MASLKPLYTCILIAGIFFLLASIGHSLGLGATLAMINSGDISAAYADTAVIIWVFGSITMFLIGCTLIFLSGPLKKLSKGAWRLAMLIGGGMTGFGGGFFIAHPGSFHMLGFLLIGLLIVIPLLIYYKPFHSAGR